MTVAVSIKSLADLKRAIKLGVTLTLVACNKKHKYLGVPRKVVQVNTRGFGLLPDNVSLDTEASYLDWPKATEVRFAHGNEFTVSGPHITLTYEVKP